MTAPTPGRASFVGAPWSELKDTACIVSLFFLVVMLRILFLVIGRRYVLLVFPILPPYLDRVDDFLRGVRLLTYRVFLFLKRGILAGKGWRESGVTLSGVWYSVS